MQTKLYNSVSEVDDPTTGFFCHGDGLRSASRMRQIGDAEGGGRDEGPVTRRHDARAIGLRDISHAVGF